MVDDIKRARVKRTLKRLKQRALGGDEDVAKVLEQHAETLDGLRYTALAQEQVNPLQEMLAAFLVSTFGGQPIAAQAMIADAMFRLHTGEPMGGALDPARVMVGRQDARTGKPPEAPDVGYLSAYCDMLIELEEGA